MAWIGVGDGNGSSVSVKIISKLGVASVDCVDEASGGVELIVGAVGCVAPVVVGAADGVVEVGLLGGDATDVEGAGKVDVVPVCSVVVGALVAAVVVDGAGGVVVGRDGVTVLSVVGVGGWVVLVVGATVVVDVVVVVAGTVVVVVLCPGGGGHGSFVQYVCVQPGHRS